MDAASKQAALHRVLMLAVANVPGGGVLRGHTHNGLYVGVADTPACPLASIMAGVREKLAWLLSDTRHRRAIAAGMAGKTAYPAGLTRQGTHVFIWHGALLPAACNAGRVQRPEVLLSA
jgi:hypothetical protein